MAREKEKAGCKEISHPRLSLRAIRTKKKKKKPSLADQEQAERGTQRERNLRPVTHASHPQRAQRQQGSAKAENEPKEKRQSTRGKSLTLCPSPHGYRRNKKRVSNRRKRRRRELPKMQGERLTACFPQTVTHQAPETMWFSSIRQERKRNWRRKVTHKLSPGTSQPRESSKSTQL